MIAFTDHHLQSETEEQLAESLPELRTLDMEGKEVWITSSPHHALDVGIPVIKKSAETDEEGKETKPAEFASGFHANLRLVSGHPDEDGIMAGIQDFVVNPKRPQRIFS